MNTNTKGAGTAIGLCVFLSLSLLPHGESLAVSGSLAERITHETTEFIIQRVTLPYDSISVDVEVPQISARPSEIAHFSADLVATTKPVMGTVPVKITAVLHSGESMQYIATARVRIWSKAAVAARRLKRHDVVGDEDIRFERREVTRAHDGYFPGPEEIVGNRATRVVPSGGLLTASSVEPVPLITRGSNVNVTVLIGAVAITSRGKALEDGCLGSLIDVRDCATGKRMTAEVIGENLVLLQVSRL
jgi:flagella basal body P-ring formation protein FlgA